IVPVSGSGWNNHIVINGKRYQGRDNNVNFNAIGSGYFRTMGTPILAGRDFDQRVDTETSAKVAIVNRSFVERFFSGQNPIGQSFQVDEPPGVPNPLYQINAVVKDTKYTDLRQP